MYRGVFWREIDLDNLCRNYEIERSRYEYTYLDEDNKDEQKPLTEINNGLKIVIGSIKRFLRNLIQSIKNFIQLKITFSIYVNRVTTSVDNVARQYHVSLLSGWMIITETQV